MLYNFGIAYPYTLDIVKRRITKLNLRMNRSYAPVDLGHLIEGASTKEGKDLNKFILNLLGITEGPWLFINPSENEIIASGTE